MLKLGVGPSSSHCLQVMYADPCKLDLHCSQVPTTSYRYDCRLFNDVPVVEEVALGAAAGAARRARLEAAGDLGSQLRCHDLVHADCITALLGVEGYNGGMVTGSKMLFSASRDGCIKVWK